MGVKLELEKSEVNLGDTVRATVTVSNDGDVPARLPKPELWLPSVSLHVTRRPDATEPESHIMRIGGEPEAVQLAPGESLSGVIEFPAVEPRGVYIEALYRPTGRIHPQFIDTSVERSERVPLIVRANGQRMLGRITTEAGVITLEFYPDKALNHVVSFVTLARQGYFNGVSFHRVVPDFVIQGGDPTGSGSGGPGYRLPAEFNDELHKPGILSMARTSDPHSAGSQFFICTADCPNLDRQYTVFGKVIDGMDAVMQIGESDSNAGKFHMQAVEIVLEPA
jgi:peptidyl-prolyl cis-trans isomerase B (cyclophilin B)